MAEEVAAHHLLNVLEERDLAVDLDSVLVAFESEDSKNEAAAWVDEYLKEDTLLTKDELDVYNMLSRKSLVPKYEQDVTILNVQPIYDHQIYNAVETLKGSTAAIEEQCRVLESQRDAVKTLRALAQPNLPSERMWNERRRRRAQERGHLDIAIEDLATAITEQLTEAQMEADAARSALATYATERLDSDDRLLTALPKILSNISTAPNAIPDDESVRQWCKAIISFKTTEAKARIDKAYLSALGGPPRGDLTDGSIADLVAEKQALQEELETLHSEIAPVAQMVVERELRGPILQANQRDYRQCKQQQDAWSEYVLSTLGFLIDRLSIVKEHASGLRGVAQALERFTGVVKERIADSPSGSSAGFNRPTASSPMSGVPRPVKLEPIKPIPLPPSVENALRQAGVACNEKGSGGMREPLTRIQHERHEKANEIHSSMSEITKRDLGQLLSEAEQGRWAVLDALYCNTTSRDLRFTGQPLQDRLNTLAEILGDYGRKTVDLGSEGLSVREHRALDFTERWST